MASFPSWFNPDNDADWDTVELQAAANRAVRSIKAVHKRYAAGDIAGAASACRHGGGYPLNSLAATLNDDPGAKQHGYRCLDCGSRLSACPFDGPTKVLVPCEIPPRAWPPAPPPGFLSAEQLIRDALGE